jgi:hypothetical protein
MTGMGHFKVGDTVEHSLRHDTVSRGIGHVIAITERGVSVQFADGLGIYDANWFRTHPDTLRLGRKES